MRIETRAQHVTCIVRSIALSLSLSLSLHLSRFHIEAKLVADEHEQKP